MNNENLIKILWRMIDAAFMNDSEEESLRFKDKMLLEDVLRYGSLTKIAEMKGVTPSAVSEQYRKAMKTLSSKLLILESAAKQRTVKREEDKLSDARQFINEKTIKSLKEEIADLKSQLAKAKEDMAHMEDQRDKAVKKVRELTMDIARSHQANATYKKVDEGYKRRSK